MERWFKNVMSVVDYRLTIIDALDAMRKKSVADKEPFKARAYQKVITQLKHMDRFIKEDIVLLQGAGEKITAKINEIMETGSLASAEAAKEKYNMGALDAFQQIYGVGPVKAASLVEHGITSIEELRAIIDEHPELLNAKQTIGLAYYEPLLERIPYEEMKQHETILLGSLHELEDAHGEVVGSFRRSAASSGDVDFLVTGNVTINKIVDLLDEKGYLIETLALGRNKFMGICSLGTPRRLDILVVKEEEYPYALLYFTGSQQFNIAFRKHALLQGYSLNEYAMTPIINKPVPPQFRLEREIFMYLGLRYVEPRHRVDGKQIQLL